VVELLTRVGQSRPLYAAAVALRDGPDGSLLDEAQRRVLDAAIRGAELSGVALEGAAKARFNEIQMELAELSTTFSNNVLDATKAYELILRSPAEVDGLPTTARELAAQSYREAQGAEAGAPQAAEDEATAEQGPWRITLDGPSLSPFLQHATRRDLREQVYRAYVSRASEGDTDNRRVIDRILVLRAEKAGLLGFADFASLSLARKMADSVSEIRDLLGELRERAWPAAQRDHAELQAFAVEHGFEGELRHWDVGFWAERLREHRYAITDEQLRPYFPLPKVLDGLFALADRRRAVAHEVSNRQANRLAGTRERPAAAEAVRHPGAAALLGGARVRVEVERSPRRSAAGVEDPEEPHVLVPHGRVTVRGDDLHFEQPLGEREQAVEDLRKWEVRTQLLVGNRVTMLA